MNRVELKELKAKHIVYPKCSYRKAVAVRDRVKAAWGYKSKGLLPIVLLFSGLAFIVYTAISVLLVKNWEALSIGVVWLISIVTASVVCVLAAVKALNKYNKWALEKKGITVYPREFVLRVEGFCDDLSEIFGLVKLIEGYELSGCTYTAYWDADYERIEVLYADGDGSYILSRFSIPRGIFDRKLKSLSLELYDKEYECILSKLSSSDKESL